MSQKTQSVKFGKVEASVIRKNDNEIVTTVPKGANPGDNLITVEKDGIKSNTFSYKVLSGDQNQVIFHVKANTNYGENIYVVGNIPELGSWNVDNCSEALMCPNYPEWYMPVSVPAGKTIEFKFIKKDSNGNVTWESGTNRVVSTSNDSCGVVNTEMYSFK